MKVLFIAPGNDNHAIRWIDQMNNLGVEVIFIDSVPNFNSLPIEARKIDTSKRFFVHEKFFARKSLLSVRRYLHYKNHIQKTVEIEKPDLIHIHWLFDLPQLAATRIKKVPKISTPYGSDILRFKELKWLELHKFILNNLVTRAIVKKSNYFTCGALHMKSRLIQLGAKESHVRLIYFGTDTANFSPKLKSKRYRQDHKLEENSFLILSNRGLSAVYDVETFVRAAGIFLKSVNNAVFIIANDGPLMSSLQDLTRKLGISSRVKFLGGLSESEMKVHVANCDIFVSTSTSDGGLAVSIAEAMSSEIAVLITRFEENEAWLEDESAGLVFDIGNAEELANKLQILFQNRVKRLEMGKRGREIIVKSRNKEIESAKMFDFYNNILGY